MNHRVSKRFIVYGALILALVFAASCATTGLVHQEAAVVTYEGVALSLNAAKAYIKGQEVSGALKGEALDKAILQWEQARLLFIQAGDALKAAISAADPATQAEKLKAYNDLLQKAAFEVGKLKGGA